MPADPDALIGVDQVHASNRSMWDRLANVHARDSIEVAAVSSGRSSLRRFETELLDGLLDGARVLHLQCHVGSDTVCLARAGARVTGVDFSPVAIEAARSLAKRCQIPVDFLCADVRELPAGLRGFDLVFASGGVLEWADSVVGWFAAAAACLTSSGYLVVVDTHPLAHALEARSDEFAVPVISPDYLHPEMQLGVIRRDYEPGRRTLSEPRGYGKWRHTLGQILEASASAGFVIERFVESPDLCYPKFDCMASVSGGWRFVGSGLPLAFGLRAHLTAAT